MRRIAAVALLLGVVVTLLVAARHNHFEHAQSQHGAACVQCTGAMMTAPSLPDPKPMVAAAPEEPWLLPSAPVVRSLLRLDYSGCAPPRA